MSRSCRNTREQVSLETAAMERESTLAWQRRMHEAGKTEYQDRIEWSGNIKIYYPATVAK